MSPIVRLSLIKFMSLGIVDKNVLLRHIDKSMILEELTHAVEGDRSTAFRSLQKLVGQCVCIRNQDNKGGAIFIESFKLGREES